jgi:hypothetical protein
VEIDFILFLIFLIAAGDFTGCFFIVSLTITMQSLAPINVASNSYCTSIFKHTLLQVKKFSHLIARFSFKNSGFSGVFKI